MIQTTDYDKWCFVEVYESQYACIMHLLVCVRMHSHYVREKGVQQCVASHLNKVEITGNSTHMSICPRNMPPAREQEHKWRKAHTYQNTTHGVASCIIPGIWHPLSITNIHYLLFCCWYPMRLRNICWLPTSHSPLVTARTHVRSAQICMMVSGHWAQSTKHIR